MRTEPVLTIAIILVFAGSFWAKGLLPTPTDDDLPGPRRPERIVAGAPAITETLFALGCGDRVVGVTDFCQYPPEVASRPRIGGFLNPNYEAIVALRPDLVVMLQEAQDTKQTLQSLRLRTLMVPYMTVEQIAESIPRIGRQCGVEAEAQRIVADIESRIERVRQKTAGLARPRVMITIERTLGTGGLQDVFVAGRDGYFDVMIDIAGGTNAYDQGDVRFPVISREGILRMNPEVIIELVSRQTAGNRPEPEILADWQQLAGIEAVQKKRIHVVRENYAFVPGPRFILLVEKLARLIHPEVD
jgi:iron complex transport system substrate-binding protein